MSTLPPILLVEDNEADLATMQDLLERAKIRNPIEVFGSGEEAIGYLKRWCERLPSECGGSALMLLDVRLPRASGFEVLSWIRAHPQLHRLVIVMTSHVEDAHSSLRAVELGAHAYLLKFPTPSTLAALARLAEASNPAQSAK